MWGPPSPGIESVAPALAGGFSTTEPLGCPWSSLAVKDSGFGRCFQARLCFLTFSLCVSSLLPRFPGASVYQLGSEAAGPGPWGLRDHRGTWGRFWTRDPFWASVLPWWAFPAWPLLPCWTSATGAFFFLCDIVVCLWILSVPGSTVAQFPNSGLCLPSACPGGGCPDRESESSAREGRLPALPHPLPPVRRLSFPSWPPVPPKPEVHMPAPRGCGRSSHHQREQNEHGKVS